MSAFLLSSDASKGNTMHIITSGDARGLLCCTMIDVALDVHGVVSRMPKLKSGMLVLRAHVLFSTEPSCLPTQWNCIQTPQIRLPTASTTTTATTTTTTTPMLRRCRRCRGHIILPMLVCVCVCVPMHCVRRRRMHVHSCVCMDVCAH